MGVMGPDEDHGSVDNNGYTNVVAGDLLYLYIFLKLIYLYMSEDICIMWCKCLLGIFY